MLNKKIKWLIYTVLVGLIPIVSRILAWLVTAAETVPPLSASDFIAFGLVLHISNINEMEHVTNDPSWKTVHNGVSAAFIAFYSVLFTLAILSDRHKELLNSDTLLKCSGMLNAVSFFLSFSIYHRISKIRTEAAP